MGSYGAKISARSCDFERFDRRSTFDMMPGQGQIGKGRPRAEVVGELAILACIPRKGPKNNAILEFLILGIPYVRTYISSLGSWVISGINNSLTKIGKSIPAVMSS